MTDQRPYYCLDSADMQAVLRDPQLGASACAVLTALAILSDRHGVGWHNETALEKHIHSASTAKLRRVLKRLRRRDYIQQHHDSDYTFWYQLRPRLQHEETDNV